MKELTSAGYAMYACLARRQRRPDRWHGDFFAGLNRKARDDASRHSHVSNTLLEDVAERLPPGEPRPDTAP
jgi:hypothetical protein